MTTQPQVPRPTLDQEAIRTHLRAAHNRPTPVTIWTAIADIPVMLAELDRLTQLLSRTRGDFADLLAAACATLTADQDGERDPLTYLRDAVAQHRTWEPPDDSEPGA